MKKNRTNTKYKCRFCGETIFTLSEVIEDDNISIDDFVKTLRSCLKACDADVYTIITPHEGKIELLMSHNECMPEGE